SSARWGVGCRRGAAPHGNIVSVDHEVAIVPVLNLLLHRPSGFQRQGVHCWLREPSCQRRGYMKVEETCLLVSNAAVLVARKINRFRSAQISGILARCRFGCGENVVKDVARW